MSTLARNNGSGMREKESKRQTPCHLYTFSVAVRISITSKQNKTALKQVL